MARLTSFNEGELLRIVQAHIEDVTDAVKAEAVRTCPRGPTGDLARSIDSEVRSAGSMVRGRVWSDLPYSLVVHDGRGPVRARPGKVLGPLPSPYPRFVRKVRAAAGQPWLLEALRRGQPYPVR